MTYSCRHCGKPLERDWVLMEWFDPDGLCRCDDDGRIKYHRALMGGEGFHEPVPNED